MMKTAAKIIASKLKYTEQEALDKKPLTIEAMKEYARQVAEAVKQACYDQINTDNRVLIKDRVNTEQFIK